MTKKNPEEIKTYTEDEFNAIVAERDELLQYKPKTLTEEEQAIKDTQNSLWEREVSLTLKEQGLEQFADVINVKDKEGLETVTQALSDALKGYQVDNAYVPTNHATSTEYDTAKKDGDTVGMLKSLFNLG